MKPLHAYQDLHTENLDEIVTLMNEYLEFGDKHPDKVSKLSYRDRFFFFAAIHEGLLRRNPEDADKLLLCKEAEEYCFLFLHNMYMHDMNFSGKHNHPITKEPISTDYQKTLRIWFDNQLNQWIKKVNAAKDIYTAEIKREIDKKRALFSEQMAKVNLTHPTLAEFDRLVYSRAFAIYHICKLIFDGTESNYIAFESGGIRFVISVKTIVHFSFRHYIPNMDLVKEARSINVKISNFDILDPVESLKLLVNQYISIINPDKNNPGEYWLYNLDGIKHIMWLRKLKKGHPAAKEGEAYEIATFYKCEEPDLTKFEGKEQIKIGDNRYAFL